MKILGWILFLSTIVIGLLVYNSKYLPLKDEQFKLVNENLMWQAQVKELQNKLNQSTERQKPVFFQVFLWDDLFANPTSFNLTEPAQVMLKEIISPLQQTTGEIIIAGHSDNEAVLPELKRIYPTDRELSYAKAMAVLNFLQSWGISKERFVCIGYGSTRPVDNNDTAEGRSKNRRIEIIVKFDSGIQNMNLNYRKPDSGTQSSIIDSIVKQ